MNTPGLKSLVPSSKVTTVVDVILDDVLSTAATNSGLRLIQDYVNGPMPYDVFAGQWQSLLTSSAQAGWGTGLTAATRTRRYRWISLAAGALIVVMTYFPIVFVVSNSLKTGVNIVTSGVFSLFTQFDYQNYITAWAGVRQSLLNTVIVAAASIVIGVTSAALGAYAFSQLRFRGKGLLFMAYVALLLIPWTLTLIPLFLTSRSWACSTPGGR